MPILVDVLPNQDYAQSYSIRYTITIARTHVQHFSSVDPRQPCLTAIILVKTSARLVQSDYYACDDYQIFQARKLKRSPYFSSALHLRCAAIMRRHLTGVYAFEKSRQRFVDGSISQCFAVHYFISVGQ